MTKLTRIHPFPQAFPGYTALMTTTTTNEPREGAAMPTDATVTITLSARDARLVAEMITNDACEAWPTDFAPNVNPARVALSLQAQTGYTFATESLELAARNFDAANAEA